MRPAAPMWRRPSRRCRGVTSCTVSLLTNSMTVEGSAAPADVVAAVEAAGYGAAEKGARREAAPAADELKDTETPRMVHRLIASIIFWLPLMYIMGWMLWRWPLPPFSVERSRMLDTHRGHGHQPEILCQRLQGAGTPGPQHGHPWWPWVPRRPSATAPSCCSSWRTP